MLQPKQVELESADPKVVVLKQGGDVPLVNLNLKVFERGVNLDLDNGVGGGNSVDGNGGDGRFPPGGGGGGGDDGGDHEENNKGEEEFGPLLKFDEVMREVQVRGATLPSDMLQAAKTNGIRKLLLHKYLDLLASPWPLGMAMRSCSFLCNRMLVDPAFLFKVGTEVVIDSCCATFAEVQKRGEDFWAEFELFTADILVGVVVYIALVGLLAPYTRFGQHSTSKGFFGGVQCAYAALPSSIFEAERPGCKFFTLQRVGTYFFKGVLFASVGFFCGIIGQGIARS